MFRLQRVLSPLMILGFAAALMSCSDDSNGNTTPDGGAKIDATKPTEGGTVTGLTCDATKGNCKDYVVSKLKMPSDNTAKENYAFVQNGVKYNRLGDILVAVVGMVQSVDIQASVDKRVNMGEALLLMRMQTGDKIAGQSWVGEAKDCCPTNKGTVDTEPDKCAAEALTTCFNATTPATFKPSASSPTVVMSGTMTGNNVEFKAEALPFNLPFGDANLSIEVKKVTVKGTLAGDKVENGVINGVIPKSQIDSQIIPAVAKILDDMLNDPSADQTTKDAIKTLVPPNASGHITEAEVKNSALANFMQGDVEISGEKMLSVGFGFEAVKAVIDDK